MKCPYCTTLDTKVIDSRINQTGDITRRRRECPRCEGRFTTYERVEEIMPLVVKKDGRREQFDRQKIVHGIKLACQKRPISSEQIESVVDDLERKLQESGEREVNTAQIGEIVMQRLHEIDDVAYVRFASVYRSFKDIGEFMSELRDLASERKGLRK